MENVSLVFYGTEESETDQCELKCYTNKDNELFIQIDDGGQPPVYICLNEQTAVKLSKVIRKEIGIIKLNSNG